tara:strand:- start:97 stop:723 length:627 start_codon:yes stop_codon:yes gene_type:complete
MFAHSSVVNTVSYSDGNVSYEDFLEKHQLKHQQNVYISQTIRRKSLNTTNDKTLGYEPNLQHGGHNNVKLIQQHNKEGKKNKPRKNLKDNNKVNYNNFFSFRKKGTVKFIIRYLISSKYSYPFHKILTYLKKKFDNQFKNSLSYESFNVKYININGGDKRYNTIHITVGINYNNPRALEISDLGNKFQNHTLNDANNQIIFLLQNYEM